MVQRSEQAVRLVESHFRFGRGKAALLCLLLVSLARVASAQLVLTPSDGDLNHIEDINVNYVQPILGIFVSGGTPPYTLTVSSGQLPPGESVSSGSNFGVIGIPTTLGNYTATITATDSSTPTALTGTIVLGNIVLPDVSLVTTSLPTGTVGTPYSTTLAAAGGYPSENPSYTYIWSYTGTLPPGLTLNPSTGVISGTPTAGGPYSVFISVTDADNPFLGSSATGSFSLNVGGGPNSPTISGPASLPAGTQGTPYGPVTFAATGGTGTGYTWSETGALPAGMSFSAGGILSGTPTSSGSFPINFKVTDSGSNSAFVTLTLTIGGLPLSVTGPASLPIGVQGAIYSSVTFTATGGTGTGYTWSETGALPAGMIFSAGGSLGGTPTSSGAFPITFKVTDSGSNSASVTLTLTINSASVTISSPASLPNGTQGVAYSSLTFVATGGTGTGYTWSETGALPTGMSFSPGGVLSGTPSQFGTFPITFKVTDSGSNSGTAALTLTILLPTLTISSPTSLPAGAQGVAYSSVTFAATGGTGTGYTWSETGALPAGMSFSGGGVLSGTPTASGSFPITFKVIDSGSNSATTTLTLTINTPGLTISSPTSLPAAAQGVAYSSVTFAATGGTGTGYTWSETGALPAGMNFSSGGVLSGTPTASGSFPITFKVTDSLSNSATTTLTLTINTPGLTIGSPTSLPAGAQGVAYSSVTFAATGGTGTGYTWSETGALPAGMSFSSGGVLSGTPAASGSFPITFKVTDSGSNSATVTLTLTINASAQLTIGSPASLPAGAQGAAYSSVTFTATGGTGTGYTWSETGALPAGMSFSAGGVLSGTPAASGTFPITFKVTDSGSNSATATLTLTVNAPAQLTISSPTSLPAGTLGVQYGPVTFAATGGTGAGYTWSEAGALPAGMSFSSGGVLSGTPTAPGSFAITFKVTDSGSNSATAILTLTIASSTQLTIGSPTSLAPGTLGVQYGPVTFAAVGGTGFGYTWSETGALPTGMSFSAGGVLSGTPTSLGITQITFKVTDSGGNAATTMLALAINTSLTISSPTALPAATEGAAYAQTFQATGGTGTGYAWSVSGQPTGLTINPATGVFGGTPASGASAGSPYTVKVSVVDSGGDSTSVALKLVVNSGSSTGITLSTNSLTFSSIQGGTAPVTQSFGVSGTTGQTTFSVSASTTSGGSWLAASAASNQTPGNVTVGLQNLGSLVVGTYQGSVLVQPGGQSVSVTLQVLSSQPQFGLSSTDVRFAVTAGSPTVSGTIQVINTGGGALSFSANLDTPASWLNITCGTQGISVTTGSPGLICLQVNPAGLAPDTYTDTLAVLSGGQEIDATVTLQVNSSVTALVLSATAITFTAVAGSPVVSPSAQSSAVVNTGSGTLNWTAQLDASTSVSWLSIAPASGNSLAYGGSQPAVTFTPNPAGLAAGDYYAVVDMASADAPGAFAQTVILLKVLPSGSQVPPATSASGLIFTVLVGGSISTAQTLTFTSANGQAVGFTALLATGLSATGQQIPDWVSGLPASGTIPGSGNFPVPVQVDPGSLPVGTYSSQLRFGFSNGTSENVAVVMLVTTLPNAGTTALLRSAEAIFAAASASSLPACTTNLALVFTQPLPPGLQAGDALTMDLSTGCAPSNYKDINPNITIYNSSQQQLAQFTLQSGLTYIGNGVFEASWQSPVYVAGQTVSIVGSANPFLPGLSVAPPSPATFSLYLPSADASAAVDLGVRNAASFGIANEVAPGSFISIFGQQLASGAFSAGTVPFPTNLGGVQVTLGETLLPLYFVNATQINAIVPFLSGSSVNGTQTLILYTNCPPVGPACQVTAPLNMNVVPIQPGLFSQNSQGNGQGSIQNASYQLVDSNHPAKAGDEIVIYATGLGPVTNPPPAGAVAPGGNTSMLTPTVYFGTIQAAPPAYSGLTPGSVDLYQVNVVVPQGVAAGTVNVMLQMTDSSGSIPITYQSNVVTIATTN